MAGFAYTALLALVLALLSACPAAALFEEQAGISDWRLPLVGHVTHAHFLPAPLRRIVVTTTDGVVASLDSPDGGIVWRRVLASNIEGTLVHQQGVVVLTNDGDLHALDHEGFVQWERSFTDSAAVPQPSSQLPRGLPRPDTFEGPTIPGILVALPSGGVALVAVNGTLHAVGLSDGHDLWQANLAALGTVSHVGADSDSDNVFVAGKQADGTVVVQKFAMETGEAQGSQQAFQHANSDSCVSVGLGALACLRATGGPLELSLLPLGSSQPRIVTGAAEFQLSGFADVSKHSEAPIAVATSQSGGVVFTNTGGTSLEAAAKISTGTVVCAAAHAGSYVFATLSRSSNDNLKLAVHGLNGKVIEEGSLPLEAHYGRPAACFVRAFSRSSGGVGVSLLVRSEDGALHAFKSPDTLRWTRSEHLAYILASKFVDLPPRAIDFEAYGNRGGPLSHFVARITDHVLQLRDFVLKAESAFVQTEEEPDSPARDAFNQRKFIVAVTATGKLVAMNSVNGRVAWERLLPVGQGPYTAKLYALRSSTHFAPVTAAVMSSKDATSVFLFNPLDGSIIQDTSSKPLSRARVVGLLPLQDEAEVQVLAVIDQQESIHLFPSLTAEEALKQRTRPAYLFGVDSEQGIVTGYQVDRQTDAVRVERTWQMLFSPEVESIEAVSSKPTVEERTNSIGEPLADGSVMFKFLNPHVIAIATLSPYNKGSATLNVYLIDVVKGVVLDKSSHEHVVGPVHLAQAENWVVYHYRNRKQKRHEVGVIELYEGGNKDFEQGFSSRTSPSPIVVRQSFILPASVTALGITVTEWGITDKQLIFATANGGLLALNKHIVNARRPTNQPTSTVGLAPYHPMLPVDNRLRLNYNLTLERIAGISTGASGLESTSLVFAHGRDLFFCFTAPSKKFDVLNDDFNVYVLILSLVVLAGVTLVLSALNKKKVIEEQWK